MKTIKLLSILCILTLTSGVYGKVRVQSLTFENEKNNKVVTVKYQGVLTERPELTIKDSIVQVVLKNAVVWPKIEKKVGIKKGKRDTTLMAYQFNAGVVRVRALLPYSLKGREGLVTLKEKENKIFVHFPTATTVTKKVTKKKMKYDESFLNRLIDDSKKMAKGKTETAVEDKVGTVLSGTEKASVKKKPSFSLSGYIGKFVAFLGIILVIFYFVVTLMKKGVLKKGKLGFLNNMNTVSVLNTTYMGPKKSIVLVKVHNQVFLLGNSDKGINFLSEVTGVNDLIKDGEKDVAGNNFDTTLTDAEVSDVPQKLKVVGGDNSVASLLNDEIKVGSTRDKVKLSDQIKKKVKNLKTLQ